MATPTDIKPNTADKRTAILEATLKLVSERGFHNTPMSVIVKKSGVSTGIVYHYFGNKDDLIVELYHEIKTKWLRSMLAGYDEAATYQDRFLYLWKKIVHYYLTHADEVKFLEQYEHSPYYDENWEAHYSDEVLPLLNFFVNGKQEGVLKELPIEVLMTLSMATAISLAKQHIQENFQLTEEIIDAAALAGWDTIRK